MKNIIIIIFSLTILISCNHQKRADGKRELVPYPEKFVHDGYIEMPDSLKPKFIPDTLIGKISLINPNNVNEYLGENVMDRLIDNGLPNSFVLSKNLKQRLTFYFHPGNGINDFSEFKISYNTVISKEKIKITENEFETESGIKLGISIGDLRSIKGEPNNITKNEMVIYHYKIDDYENSEFLKKYNMPSYYADYEFKNGYLVEFRFGFNYP